MSDHWGDYKKREEEGEGKTQKTTRYKCTIPKQVNCATINNSTSGNINNPNHNKSPPQSSTFFYPPPPQSIAPHKNEK